MFWDRPIGEQADVGNRLNKRVRVFVRGLVQGVFFRESTRRAAEDRGVKGWVRNVADGSVEGVFEGAAPRVDRLVEWCRLGPPSAEVEEVEVVEEAYRGEFDRFVVR